MKSAIILGGGPAGCQCALWLKMLGHDPLLIERQKQLGGLQRNNPFENNWMVGLPNKLGMALAGDMHDHVLAANISVLLESQVNRLVLHDDHVEVTVSNQPLMAKYFVIATGVRPRKDILVATENVLIGPGANIFNYDFSGKRVAILGAGDNAAENYSFIKSREPALCHVYARHVKARPSLWQCMAHDDIFYAPYEVDQAFMTILHGKTRHQYDVMVVLYGFEANVACLFNPYKSQLLDANGYIKTNADCETAYARIFAIGEVTNRMHPCVITAMADGVVAAKAIQRRLK